MSIVSTQPAAKAEDNSLLNILQLAYQLNQANKLSGASDNAAGAAADANANYRARYNATESVADTYAKLIAALQPTIASGMDESGLVDRTNQIFSALVPTVDRANSIAASQGYAQALKRGMGDSTQAADAAGNMTRQFGDVYQKLMETSRQRAFDELKAKLAGNTQALQLATQGFQATNPLQTAQQVAASAATRATNAQTAYQKSFADILSSNIADYAAKAIQKDGLSGLTSALSTGLNDIWYGKGKTGGNSSASSGPDEVPDSSYNPYAGHSSNSFGGYTTGSDSNYSGGSDYQEPVSWGGENFSGNDNTNSWLTDSGSDYFWV